MAMRVGGARAGPGFGGRAEIQRYRPQISSKIKNPNGNRLSNTLKQQAIAQSFPWAAMESRNSGTGIGMESRRAAMADAEGSIISYQVLEERLASEEWALADEETRRLLIVLAGDAAVKRNYVFFSEVQFIAASDLITIDQLWRKHSKNRFGYSVQRRIWNKVNQDFTEFFKKVGWMKRLEQAGQDHYSYRSFPAEFVWDLGDSTPEGHLPLTNALRGTQLLATIFQHPAFQEDQEDQILNAKQARISSLTPNYNF